MQMSASKLIKFIECDTAGIIQLNRPSALNALNIEMWKSTHELISRMEHQKDLIILKGAGKIFCAGGDIKDLSSGGTDRAYFAYSLGCRSFDLIANYKKPFVVFIDGLAMGGAAIYAMSAKYRIATERTAFSMPETIIGYFNDAGSSYFLSRLDNNFGMYIGLTGTQVKGIDMKNTGLATHFIESRKLEEIETSLSHCKTQEDVEKVLNESSSQVDGATELDNILTNIKKCFSGVTVEQIYENLELDGSDWAKKTLSTLKSKSPTSLKVSHRSIATGKKLSLRDCLKMEMALTINYSTDGSDVKEGVRALLIDKDMKPNWKRKTIYDVTDEDVAAFFRPVPEKYELTFDELVKYKL